MAGGHQFVGNVARDIFPNPYSCGVILAPRKVDRPRAPSIAMQDETAPADPAPRTVAHEERDGGGAFVIEHEGVRLAEMSYRRIGHSRVLIEHTWVRPDLRGKRVARNLLDALVLWARRTGTRVGATCSYAVLQFARDSSISDVRDEG
jgi:predicted GNAT family acetyltransferase